MAGAGSGKTRVITQKISYLIDEAGYSAKEIAARVKRPTLNKRPLFENLHNEELKDKIEFLRSQRIPFYKQAHIVFNPVKNRVEELIAELKDETETEEDSL